MLRYTLLRKALNTNGVDTNLLEWPFALSSTHSGRIEGETVLEVVTAAMAGVRFQVLM